MGLRILHTSDWHLGHRLHDRERSWEHRRFLEWLLATLEEERVDALIIAGDIFDVAHPGAETARVWYGFLADVTRRLPGLDVIVVAGNHDSATRLDAPREVLAGLGPLHVVGALRRDETGQLDLEKITFPLHDRDGQVAAWCGALPYLRPSDLPSATTLRQQLGREEVDTLLDGTRDVYARVLARLEEMRSADQALIATGHLFLSGASLSVDSERMIQRGNQEAMPADVFDPAFTYVALGHLHKAQAVAGQERLRYCGSPIPLSLSEREYTHQVIIADFDGGQLAEQRQLPIPRTVDMLRVPAQEALPPSQVFEALALLEELPATDAPPLEQRPFLEVRVLLDGPRPALRREVQKVLQGKLPILARLVVERPTREGEAPKPQRELHEMQPVEVFQLIHQRKYNGAPSADMLAAFAQLVEEAQAEDEASQ